MSPAGRKKSVAGKSADAALQNSPITAAAVAARRRRGKRTQTERSTEMRTRILDATLESLVEFGFTGTSFSTIAEKAGVSRGALQHHYPEKNYVIAGALEFLTHRVQDQFLAQAVQMPRGVSRIVFVLDRLWLATITPPMPAIADVRTAARTDLGLRAMLLPIEHQARDRHYQVVGEAIGGDLANAPAFRQRVDALLATMRGLCNQLAYGWELPEIQDAWSVARDDCIAGLLRAATPDK